MTEEEAKKITYIACTADSGCPSCARDLIDEFGKSFPEYKDLFSRIYDEEFGVSD